jgi:hypothetical protein
MYTIELTEGPGWNAPTLQARVIKTTVDIAKVEYWRPNGCRRCGRNHPLPTGPMAGGSSMGLGDGLNRAKSQERMSRTHFDTRRLRSPKIVQIWRIARG